MGLFWSKASIYSLKYSCGRLIYVMMSSGVQVVPFSLFIMFQHRKLPYFRFLQILPEKTYAIDLVFKAKIFECEHFNSSSKNKQ